DLGLEASIVGVTKFCVHPPHIKSKVALVGGTKQIHIEKIKALKPDVILCNKEENTKEIVEACELICAVHVSDIYTVTDSLKLIEQYGNLFNVKEKALHICNEIKIQQNNFEHFIEDKKRLKVAYFIWKNPWMVAANNTFINYLLTLNGFDNYYKNQNRYPQINLQVNPNIDLVMLSSEPYPFK
ncbi:ABC transporter substrate-binding protein, partial [Seonamhaeicola algicola]